MRAGAFACLALCAAAAWLPAAARAQTEPRSVLLLLDASKSMNKDAGAGRTRMDAAKAAVDELIRVLPVDAQVGLRVYGSRVAEASRAAGCRDTELLVPVGPLDRSALRARVDALQGKGRTPIGRSLRAAATDLPRGGKRTLILVSDGGDNCAPPAPCSSARAVARRGVDLSISVVGLQVNERVRRQLECIAKAGGGTYVDANDADALRRELLAAFARAFRTYQPVGTPVRGGDAPSRAARLGAGQYVDSVQAGQERWYAVRLRPAQRLFASATAITPRSLSGSGRLAFDLADAGGRTLRELFDVIRYDPFGQFGNVDTLALRTAPAAARGIPSDVRPGDYLLHLALDEGDLSSDPIPVEIAIQPLGPGERPSFVRPPGALPAALGAGRTSSPRPGPTPTPATGGEGGGPSAAAVAGVGVAGLLVGLIGGGLALGRRRR